MRLNVIDSYSNIGAPVFTLIDGTTCNSLLFQYIPPATYLVYHI